MKGYIYTLSEKNDIFYVGCTTNPITRLYAHNNRFKFHEYYGGFCSPKKNFNGVKMEVVEEIEVTTYKELLPLENYWIHQFIAWGFELINISYARVNKPIKDRCHLKEVIQKFDHFKKHRTQEELIKLGWI